MTLTFGTSRLSRRLIAAMLLITIPVMFTGVIVLSRAASSYIHAGAREKLENTALHLAGKVDSWANEAVEHLSLHVSESNMAAMDPVQLRDAVKRFAAAHPHINVVHIMGPDGFDVARSDNLPFMDFHDRRYFQEAIAGADVSNEIIISRTTNRPALSQAVPIRASDGHIVGVFATTLHLSTLSQIVGAARYGETGYSFVVDERGRVLAHPEAALALRLKDLSTFAPVREMLANPAARELRFKDANGTWWLASGFLLGRGWRVLSLQQESEVMAQVNHVFRLSLSVMFATAVVIALLAWLSARRLIRPITQMTAMAAAIAKGDWSLHLDAGRSDELGQLAGVLNSMVADLAKMYQNMTQTSHELRESERAYRRIVETTIEGVWVVNAEGTTTFANKAMAKMLGYTVEEMLGRSVDEFVFPEDRELQRERIQARKNGFNQQEEFRFQRKNGTPLWALIAATTISDDNGKPVGLLGMFTDITERRRTEKLQIGQTRVLELLLTGRPLEEVLSTLVLTIEQHIPGTTGAVLLIDPTGQHMSCAAGPNLSPDYVSDIAAIIPGPFAGSSGTAAYLGKTVIVDDTQNDTRWTGYRASAARNGIRSSWSQPVWSSRKKVLGTFTLYSCVSRRPTADEQRLIELAAYLAGVVIERRQEEDTRTELQRSTMQSLSLLDTLQSHAPVGFAFIDRNFRFIRVNETLAAMNGGSIATHIGRCVADIIPHLWPQIEPLFQKVLAGNAVHDVEITGDTPLRPGEIRHWQISYYPVRVVGNEIVGIGVVVLETTEKKKAQEEQRNRDLKAHREAVRAMEQVLGIVGHELRTPLAGMRAVSEFLLTEYARGAVETESFIRQLNAEIIRMSETVNDLLEAARMNSGRARWHWGDFDLAKSCAEALESIRPLVDAAAVRLEIDVPVGPTMRGDADAVRRLVLNLINNARKHTAQGIIEVRARIEEIGAETWACIEVRDTGSGIAPEILSKLGEAFALNSGVVGSHHVEGTGLGLAICKGIVAAHGGSITVQSREGIGTWIKARLRADLECPAESGARVPLIEEISINGGIQ